MSARGGTHRGSSSGGRGRGGRGAFSGAKAARAKAAKEIINQTVPALLASHPRAAAGAAGSVLWRGATDLPPLARRGGADAAAASFSLRLVAGDTLDVALARRRALGAHARVAVLNMASPLQAGGGVLRGARAQEESLCLRSTLHAALKPEWYRMPEDAVAWSRDVLVFADAAGAALARADAWYVDVLSCAAVRKPELKDGGLEYQDPRDEERMALKARYVMRAAAEAGCQAVVLGALGCGAYGNPVAKVARAFRNCLVGRRGERPEDWAAAGIQEVVFAILDGTPGRRVWAGFRDEFASVDGVVVEDPAPAPR